MENETCLYGDGEPVHALGKCQRCYNRDYKRSQSPHGGTGRPPLDATVYKLRIRYAGASVTKHYSDPVVADRWARQHREAGTLLFYGKYRLEEELG